MKRSILHIDMDAFYASIEQYDNSFYKNKPIAVGGRPEHRGVVCTASYEARKFGVRSAMPSKKAQQLCPNLVFLPVRMERYIEVSNQVFKILEEYTEFVEPLSIDEAFLDLSNQDSIKIGYEIQTRIYSKLGITASVGVSINKYLAKIASGMKKPNGFTVIEEQKIHDFLKPLPIRKLWGVGPKTEKELNKMCIFTIQDILNYREDLIIEKFGKKGLELINFSRGIDHRVVENKHRRKSLGEENTFDTDIDDLKLLYKYIYDYCELLSTKLQKNQLLIKTITVKVKYEDFNIITRSITLSDYTHDFKQIYESAKKILTSKINVSRKIRLLGVQVSNILYPDEPIQLKLEI